MLNENENVADFSRELPAEIKARVDEHLFKWFAALGVVNVAALVVGLAYIFLVVPEKAVSEAKVLIETEAYGTIVELRQTLIQVVSEALVKSGEAKGISADASNEALETRKALIGLKAKAEALSNDDTVRVIDAVNALQDNPNIEELLRVVSRTHNLEQKVGGLEKIDHRSCSELITNPKYYETRDGPWGYNKLSTYDSSNATAKLMCPSGKYLAGVRVWNGGEYIDRVYCCNLH
jgi:hypothetical protein